MRREQIIASAYAVLTAQGYERTSIADIARHAHVGHGTVYRYFTDKRDLLDHVFDHAVAKTTAALDLSSLTSTQTADFEQSLALIEVFGWRLFAMIDADPGMLKLITVESSAIDPELRYRVVGLLSTLDAGMGVLFEAASPQWAAATDPRVRATFGRMMLAMSGPGLTMSLTPDAAGSADPATRRRRCLDTVAAIADRGLLTRETPDVTGTPDPGAQDAFSESPEATSTPTAPDPRAAMEVSLASHPPSERGHLDDDTPPAKQTRRSELFAAAWELFLARGYRDVDVADITARASVSQGTFYNYFPNKRAVLDLMITEVYADVAAAMDDGPALTAAGTREDFVAAFEDMVSRIIGHVCRRGPEVSFIALTAPGVDDDAFTATVAGVSALAARVTTALHHGVRHGWIRDDVDLGVAGDATVCCVVAAVLPVLLDEMGAVDTTVSAQVCSCYLLGGMRAAAQVDP